MLPGLDTYDNLHGLAETLMKTWGKHEAIKRAAELCNLSYSDQRLRMFNIMREYIQKY